MLWTFVQEADQQTMDIRVQFFRMVQSCAGDLEVWGSWGTLLHHLRSRGHLFRYMELQMAYKLHVGVQQLSVQLHMHVLYYDLA